jgi:adenine-specific DNA-methyltransferase
MDKMRMESVDMTEKNIDRVADLFPNCITEACGRRAQHS